MKREANKFIHDIQANLPEVDKAIDTLSNVNLFSYIYHVLSQRVYYGLGGLSNIENPSEFLFGVQQTLKLIDEIPEILKTSEDAKEV